MSSSLATITLTDPNGSPLRVAGVDRLHLEYSEGHTAASLDHLVYFEPVRIYTGQRGERNWLVPCKTLTTPVIAGGYEGIRMASTAIPAARFEPTWFTLAEIAEQHLPMLWMLQPGLFEDNRASFRGEKVNVAVPTVLVGLCDASGSETHAQFYGKDGRLHRDPLKDEQFQTKFQYFVSF